MDGQLNRSGQALVEWAVLLPLYGFLMFAIVLVGQWLVIRQQLIFTVREGALLYSSGRMTKQEVSQRLQSNLGQGTPAILGATIQMGRYGGVVGTFFELDEIKIQVPVPPLWRAFGISKMEETCVIKHAATYGAAKALLGVPYGRPVDW